MNALLSAKISVNSLDQVFRRKGYELAIGVHFLNVFGVRAATGLTNIFDDIVGVIYRNADDKWALEKFTATTDPGKFYLQNPMNVKGTGILVPGQYKNSHKLGLHQGKYKALVQKSPVKLFRDGNKDLTYDMDPENTDQGLFGMNIHRANEKQESTFVDKWSAACQVLASPKEFDRLIELSEMHAGVYGDSFNYTLLEEKDF
jgi:hypothetical protein